MSDQTPEPSSAQPIPHAPAPYGSPYGQQPFDYRPATRPPLSKRAKSGSVWAGAVGFNLVTLGFYLVVIPLTAVAFGTLFGFIADQILRSGRGEEAGAREIANIVGYFDGGVIALIVGGMILVGLAAMWGGLAASAAILKAHGVHRAWLVTWAGTGVAIFAYWVLGWIPVVIGQIVSYFIFASGAEPWIGVVAFAVLVLVGVFIGNAIIGWLSWWWMAFAMRPKTVEVPTNIAPAVVAPTQEVQE